MAIAVNNPNAWQTGTSSSVTQSYTVSAGDDRILIVQAGGIDGQDTVDSVTFNGNSLTQIGSTVNAGTSAAACMASLWYLLAPPVTTADIVITYGGKNTRKRYAAAYLTGAAQQAPEANSSGSNTSTNSISTNITTVTNNALVFDGIAVDRYSTLSVSGGQTLEAQQGGGAGGSGISSKIVATAGSASMGWSKTGNWDAAAHILSAWEEASSGTTYEDSVSLGLSHGFTAAGILTIPEAVTLGLSKGLSLDQYVSMQEAITLGLTAGIAASAVIVMDAGISLSMQLDAQQAATLIQEGSITLGLSQAVATAGGLDIDEAISLGLAPGLSGVGGLVLDDAISLGIAGGIAVEGEIGGETGGGQDDTRVVVLRLLRRH